MSGKKPRAVIRKLLFDDKGNVESVTVEMMDTGTVVPPGNELVFATAEKYMDFYQATKKSINWINPGVV